MRGVEPQRAQPGRRAASGAARSARTTAGSRARSACVQPPITPPATRFVSGSVSVSVTISLSPSAASRRRIRRAVRRSAPSSAPVRGDERQRGRHAVVAAQARHLLDEVLLDLEVAAPRRRRDHQHRPLAPARHAERGEPPAHLGRGNATCRAAPWTRSGRRRIGRGASAASPGLSSTAPGATAPPASRASSAGRRVGRRGHALGIDAALEAVGGLRREPEPAARAPHRPRREEGALEQHVARRRRDLARLAAHDARERDAGRARRRSPGRPPRARARRRRASRCARLPRRGAPRSAPSAIRDRSNACSG